MSTLNLGPSHGQPEPDRPKESPGATSWEYRRARPEPTSAVDPRGSCLSEIYAGAGYTASRGRGRVQCCADALAEGAILMQDLCPPCFRWLIEATEPRRPHPALVETTMTGQLAFDGAEPGRRTEAVQWGIRYPRGCVVSPAGGTDVCTELQARHAADYTAGAIGVTRRVVTYTTNWEPAPVAAAVTR